MSKKAKAKGEPWFWEDDDGDMVKFTAAYTRALESQYKKTPKGSFPLTIKGVEYTIDFKKMQQINPETKRKRKIQRGEDDEESEEEDEMDEDKEEGGSKWEWKDDKGKWKAFDEAVAKALETQWKKGTTNYSRTMNGWKYKFNLKSMVQENLETSTIRNIRRVGDDDDDDEPPKPSKSAKTSTKKPQKRPVEEEEDEEGMEEEEAKPKKAAKSAKSSTPSSVSKSTASSMSGHHGAKVVKKGRGVVDKYSGLVDRGHILEEGADVWQCTLNQTNLDANNNKFYIIQVIESDKGGQWWTWNRWARVGQIGQSKLQAFTSKEAAKADFCKKFKDKTKNDWSNRDNFVKHSGKYQYMDMDYGDDDDGEVASPKDLPDSKLDDRVKKVMELISDAKAMEGAMRELEIDVKKMPLGKISKKQVKEAFGHLKVIDEELSRKKPNSKTMMDASAMFYTLIPHDVGYSKLSTINDRATLSKKMELLDTLADLEIAGKLLSEAAKTKEHPLDAAYKKLDTNLTPMDKSSAEYKRIVQYVRDTHGKTHTKYQLEVEDVFVVNKKSEAMRYAAHKHLPNRMLLYHGSRITNWMGILSQGLRIAPPEAPVTGYMFGKGVYFADVATKSANYCHTTPEKNVGFMLLCEVAMGNMHKLKAASYMDKPPKGCQSTMGVGKMQPNPEHSYTDEDGVIWPMGKMIDTGISDTSLLYNEFIIYDTAQMKTNYLLKLKFKYK